MRRFAPGQISAARANDIEDYRGHIPCWYEDRASENRTSSESRQRVTRRREALHRMMARSGWSRSARPTGSTVKRRSRRCAVRRRGHSRRGSSARRSATQTRTARARRNPTARVPDPMRACACPTARIAAGSAYSAAHDRARAIAAGHVRDFVFIEITWIGPVPRDGSGVFIEIHDERSDPPARFAAMPRWSTDLLGPHADPRIWWRCAVDRSLQRR